MISPKRQQLQVILSFAMCEDFEFRPGRRKLVANVYLEARSNSCSKDISTHLCVVLNCADQLLGTFRNQKEATVWARAMG